jgi:transposase-like protein
MAKPKLTSKQYVERGGAFCPYCESSDIEGGKFDAEGDQVFLYVECHTCGRTWTDFYTLSGYTEED